MYYRFLCIKYFAFPLKIASHFQNVIFISIWFSQALDSIEQDVLNENLEWTCQRCPLYTYASRRGKMIQLNQVALSHSLHYNFYGLNRTVFQYN